NGVQEIIGTLRKSDVVHLDCRGAYEDSHRVTLEFLKKLPSWTKVLIAAINGPAAVGAARAAREARRKREATVVVGQDATHDVRTEMNRSGTCLIGSVGYFPEKYGDQIVPLVLKMLGGEPVPPTAHIEHVLINRQNASLFYPES